MADMTALAGLFTGHHIDGVGSFHLATDGTIHDEMHAGIRDGSQLAHSTLRYILSRLQAGDRFVDVGANLGSYAIPAAMKGCRVLAIEALPENYTLLCQSVAKNALTSLTPVHAAAFDRVTTVGMVGASAWGTISETRDGVVVPALPLDDLLAIHGFSEVELLKLDIEGAELIALQGLRRHLAEGRIGEIVVEVNEPACRAAGTSGEALLRVLHDHGFHLYLFLGDRLVPRGFDAFRELYNCDFLATRHPLKTPPAGFTVEALPIEASVGHLLAQANSPFESCRLHVALSMARAPAAVRDNPEIRAALARLQDDPIPAIREASGATLLVLAHLSPDMAHPVAALSSIETINALKAPAIATAVSAEGRNPYRNRERRIAVVAPLATYCGVAHYGRNFCRNLVRAGFDAELITFDDEVMRRPASQYRAFGHAEIADICGRLEHYDAFSLQFEPGTLGAHVDMLARLRRLMRVKRPVAIDFHTIHRPPSNDAKARLKSTLGLLPRYRHWRHEYRHHATWRSIYKAIGEREGAGDLAVIAHTHEDHEYFTRLQGLRAVEHHPLAYFDDNDRAAILRQVPRRRRQLELALRLEPTDVLLGVFGFIAPHKGTHHAIEALAHLPANFKLAIFGQHHPTSIPVGQTDPYLSSLVKQIEKLELTNRVFFIGDLADVDFSVAIASVDLAVFPYHEVGQRSSGPIQMAIDIGMPILCSRTHCFQALSRYYPNRLRFFDIGNHLQLAQLAHSIGAGHPESAPASAPAEFTTRTLIAQFDDLLGRIMR